MEGVGVCAGAVFSLLVLSFSNPAQSKTYPRGRTTSHSPRQQPKRVVEVFGHRGARAKRPENTLAAFKYALQVGVDYLELDVAVTADNIPVVVHDLYVNAKICLAPGGKRIHHKIPIRTLTYDQLRTYDCGTLVNPDFPDQQPSPGEHIPSLAELFEYLNSSSLPNAHKVKLSIEAKSVPARTDLVPPPEEFASILYNVIKQYGFVDRVVIQSFDHRVLRCIRKLDPNIKISALIAENLPDLACIVSSLHPDIVSPNFEWITGKEVELLHKLGVRVVVWTVNKPQEWERLVRIGVDGIITDDPAGLIQFLQQRGLR